MIYYSYNLPTLLRIFGTLRWLIIWFIVSWFHFVHTQKKRDCTVAVPLFEALELPFHLNKQHRSPRRYVHTRTHLSYGVYGYEYTYPEDIKMLQCLGWLRIFQVPNSQAQSALDTPYHEFYRGSRFDALLCLQPSHPKDIIPRRGLITGAKVQQNLRMCKKNHLKMRFFYCKV